jgi:hypothetical protein
MFRQFYNRPTGSPLPRNKQWVTLGGPIVNKYGVIKPHSEYPQLISCGLTPRQFFSVERELTTHNLNSTIVGPTWRLGDIYFVVAAELNNPTFNPGFLNLDLYSMPLRGGLQQLSQFTDLFTGLRRKILIASNFILKNDWYGYEDDYHKMPDVLVKHTNFGSVRHLWHIEGIMMYRNWASTMGTIILSFNP